MNDSALRRAGRTLLQVIGAGGLTAVIAVLADGLNAEIASLLVALNTVLVTWAQNFLEDRGSIPAVLGTKDPAQSSP